MKRLLILPIMSLIGAAMFCSGIFSQNETAQAPDSYIVDNTPAYSEGHVGENLQNVTTRPAETTPSIPAPSAPSQTEQAPIVTPSVPDQTTTRFDSPNYNSGNVHVPEIEVPVLTDPPVTTTTQPPVVTTTPAVTTTTTAKPPVTTQPITTTKPTVGVTLDVPMYYQFDSRWKNVYIGTKTIGDVGCITTCISMVYSYHTDSEVFPNVIKKKLSYSNNDLAWGSLERVDLTYKTYNGKLTNDMLKTIYTQLKEGNPVIIGATSSNGRNQHWVVITGYTGKSTTKFSTSDFIINDPGYQSNVTLADFLENGGSADRTYIKKIIY